MRQTRAFHLKKHLHAGTGKREKIGHGHGKGSGLKMAGLLGVLLLVSCSILGCQLAKEEPEGSMDRLCGILVTTEEQEEAYRSAHPSESEEPESITLTPQEWKALQKGEVPEGSDLFSTPRVQVEGREREDGFYEFPGLEGSSLLASLWKEDEDGDYWHFTSTGVFQDVQHHVNVTDEGEFRSTEGTVKIGEKSDVIINMSLVYQRPDGSIYALLNSAAGFWNSGQTSPGSVFSRSFKEENVQTVNGNSEKNGEEFTVHVAVAQETVLASIKEWSAEDELLKETALQKGQETFGLQKDTAYAIVEEILSDGSVKRSVYTWDENAKESGLLCHSFGYINSYGLIEPTTLTFEKLP